MAQGSFVDSGLPYVLGTVRLSTIGPGKSWSHGTVLLNALRPCFVLLFGDDLAACGTLLTGLLEQSSICSD
jgi:hypothetical protein